MNYVKLLPLINNVSLPGVIKLKLLQLCLGELGQPPFAARRLEEAPSMDEALYHLNCTWGAEYNIFAKNNQPLHQAVEDPYRDELNHLLQKHATVPRITSTTGAGSLTNVALIAAGESSAV